MLACRTNGLGLRHRHAQRDDPADRPQRGAEDRVARYSVLVLADQRANGGADDGEGNGPQPEIRVGQRGRALLQQLLGLIRIGRIDIRQRAEIAAHWLEVPAFASASSIRLSARSRPARYTV